MPADLDFLVTRGTGPVRRFRISYRILLGAAFFLVLFIAVSVVVINDYAQRRLADKASALEVTRLQAELKEAKRALYRSEQRIEVLETHLNRVRSPAKGLDEASKAAGDQPGEQAVAAEEGPETPEPGAEGPRVEIENLKTARDAGKLSFSFNVVSRDGQDKPVRGYVHVIAMDKASEPPQLWTYPKAALKDGLPIDYRRGHLFMIKRFREIQGECFLNTEDQVPTALRILVYDASGTLVYDKEFPVGPV